MVQVHHDQDDGQPRQQSTVTHQVTALATGCSLVLYDGSPLHPHTAVMWDLVDRSRYPQNSHQFDPNYIEVIVDDNIDDHQV